MNDEIRKAIELDELSIAIREQSEKLQAMEVELSKTQQQAERAKRERRAMTAKINSTWTHRNIVFTTTFFAEMLKDHKTMTKADQQISIYTHTDEEVRDFARQCYSDMKEDFLRYNTSFYGKDFEDFFNLQVLNWRSRHKK